jgi:alkylhydroperoxidase family enzyme
MSRLPAATRETFPEPLKYVWDRLSADTTAGDGTATANIFLAMGNNPAVLRGYLRLGNALWANCGLDVATRELAILRAAILQHSQYEWHQHVRIGKAAGLTGKQINALHHWRQSDLFSPAERAMLQYVDAIAATDHPSQESFDELAAHYPPSTVVGISILAAFYFATAKFLGAMEVQPESAFVGWELRD